MESENINVSNKFHRNFNFLNSPKIFNDFILLQIGEMYCDNSARIGKHIHTDFFELTYVVSGKGICYANNIAVPIAKNDIFLSLPNEMHDILSDNLDPLRFYFIAFNYTSDSEYSAMINDSDIIKLNPALRIGNSQDIEPLFPKLIAQLEYENKYSKIKFEHFAKILTIDMLEIFTKMHTQNYMSPDVDNENAISIRVLNYIDNNLTKIERLSDIAKGLNYNYVYLSRVFKNKIGKSIHTYFTDKKLDMAKGLLLSSSMSVTEISSFLNYSSIFDFSRVFKNKFGCSPNCYRQKNKQSQ